MHTGARTFFMFVIFYLMFATWALEQQLKLRKQTLEQLTQETEISLAAVNERIEGLEKRLAEAQCKANLAVTSSRLGNRVAFRSLLAHYRSAIEPVAIQHRVSASLVAAVVWQESKANQNAVSRAGAKGLMQLMPRTAQILNVDPSVPYSNVDGGVRYLKEMILRYGGDLKLALAAYNAGPSSVDRYNSVPPYRETQDYVAQVLRTYEYLLDAPIGCAKPIKSEQGEPSYIQPTVPREALVHLSED